MAAQDLEDRSPWLYASYHLAVVHRTTGDYQGTAVFNELAAQDEDLWVRHAAAVSGIQAAENQSQLITAMRMIQDTDVLRGPPDPSLDPGGSRCYTMHTAASTFCQHRFY